MEMKRRGKIKRRWKVPKIIFSFLDAKKKKKKIKPVQNIFYWFQKFCTGLKILYWFKGILYTIFRLLLKM